MALKFGESKGQAVKDRADAYKVKDGRNSVRLVGDVLARYVYWIKGENGKPIPFECLAFNRQTEKFDNAEKDWVKEYYPDMKCSWAYASQCIDGDKLNMFNHKKKLYGAILDEVKDLGDPTDEENGWDIVFDKKKTGPLPINVEYTLKARELKNRPLTDAEREIIKELKSMDEVLPRPTPEQQKALLEKIKNGDSGEGGENIDEDVGDEFKVK